MIGEKVKCKRKEDEGYNNIGEIRAIHPSFLGLVKQYTVYFIDYQFTGESREVTYYQKEITKFEDSFDFVELGN